MTTRVLFDQEYFHRVQDWAGGYPRPLVEAIEGTWRSLDGSGIVLSQDPDMVLKLERQRAREKEQRLREEKLAKKRGKTPKKDPKYRGLTSALMKRRKKKDEQLVELFRRTGRKFGEKEKEKPKKSRGKAKENLNPIVPTEKTPIRTAVKTPVKKTEPNVNGSATGSTPKFNNFTPAKDTAKDNKSAQDDEGEIFDFSRLKKK
eukprot:CAMPEP_0115031572 /NCGR_PEP_ID=MMETSP0216-20121206/38621_1 /TAXON_ID=223996 /ORGANISM="Protocruzia adherens, Strain Boccale" /LENGTH=202 /DNA_ID=CAMNT_0002409263 /DNA_START=564 /DNA_END=1172 /DNA_ORIENTATION=-